MTRTVILHAHLFKNAGTTIDWILKKNFGGNFYDHRDNMAMKGGQEYLEYFFDKHPELQALSSHHLPLPLLRFRSCDAIKLIMLRHPIERVISVYNFEKKQPTSLSKGSKAASHLDLKDYVSWRLNDTSSSVISNYHVRCLIGEIGRKTLVDSDFEQACKYLSSDYLYGVVDEFDKSLQLIAHKLRIVFPEFQIKYIKKNYSVENFLTLKDKLDKLKAQLGNELYGQLLQANLYDLNLYDLHKKELLKSYSKANIQPESLEIVPEYSVISSIRNAFKLLQKRIKDQYE